MTMTVGSSPSLLQQHSTWWKPYTMESWSGKHALSMLHGRKVDEVSSKKTVERWTWDKIFCHCRMPELNGVKMIECTSCLEWYHVFCAGDVWLLPRPHCRYIVSPKTILYRGCLLRREGPLTCQFTMFRIFYYWMVVWCQIASELFSLFLVPYYTIMNFSTKLIGAHNYRKLVYW